MTRFREILRRTSDRLDLPQPVKSRIILEISADLQDIYDECVSKGMSGEEAERRAAELCDLSDEALAELVRVHETPVRRFLGSLSEQARTRWEKALLVTLLLFIVAFSGRELLTTRLFAEASRFVWPVLSVSLYALLMTLVNIYRLYIRKQYDPRRLRSGPVTVLAVGVVCLLTGFAGTVVETYSLALAIAADTGAAMNGIVDWAVSCSAMLMVALFAAIAAGIVWFVLDDRVRRMEAAETAWLFE